MSRPPIVRTDPAIPYNAHPTLRTLVANFRMIGVVAWLQEATFDEVVTWWWHAQSLKQDADQTTTTSHP